MKNELIKFIKLLNIIFLKATIRSSIDTINKENTNKGSQGTDLKKTHFFLLMEQNKTDITPNFSSCIFILSNAGISFNKN